jgi:hypothetical protein
MDEPINNLHADIARRENLADKKESGNTALHNYARLGYFDSSSVSISFS